MKHSISIFLFFGLINNLITGNSYITNINFHTHRFHQCKQQIVDRIEKNYPGKSAYFSKLIDNTHQMNCDEINCDLVKRKRLAELQNEADFLASLTNNHDVNACMKQIKQHAIASHVRLIHALENLDQKEYADLGKFCAIWSVLSASVGAGIIYWAKKEIDNLPRPPFNSHLSESKRFFCWSLTFFGATLVIAGIAPVKTSFHFLRLLNKSYRAKLIRKHQILLRQIS